MERDDIIRMAREAGLAQWSEFAQADAFLFAMPDRIERFAALVAAHEREKVAAWMMQRGFATGHGETVEEMLGEMQWQVAEAEREKLLLSAEWCRVCEQRRFAHENTTADATD